MMRASYFLLSSFLLFSFVFCGSALAEEGKAVKEKFAADDGRPFIPKAQRKDYTAELEKGYKLVVSNDKCAKCHTAARSLNTIMYDVADWKRYIKRMMNKPKANLAPEEGKLVYRFLKHDQLTRKEKNPQDFYAAQTVDRPETVSWFSEDKKPKNW